MFWAPRLFAGWGGECSVFGYLSGFWPMTFPWWKVGRGRSRPDWTITNAFGSAGFQIICQFHGMPANVQHTRPSPILCFPSVLGFSERLAAALVQLSGVGEIFLSVCQFNALAIFVVKYFRISLFTCAWLFSPPHPLTEIMAKTAQPVQRWGE